MATCRKFICLFMAAALMVTYCQAQENPAKSYGMPVEEIAVIDNFNGDLHGWEVDCGCNIQLTSQIKNDYNSQSVLQLKIDKKTPDNASNRNWFYITHKISAEESWITAEGIRLELAINRSRSWWFCVELTTKDGSRFNFNPLMPMAYGQALEERLAPFSNFKPVAGNKSTTLNNADIIAVTFSGTGNAGSVYINSISLYKTVKKEQWIEVKAKSNYGGNMFQRDEQVRLVFLTNKKMPPKQISFSYEISNYYGSKIEEGIIPLKAECSRYDVSPAVKLPGYYEVRAFGIDEGGNKNEESCVVQQGSVPGAFATFAIMPKTVEENIKRMMAVGEDAFFGLHNVRRYLNIQELIGFPWMFQYNRWQNIEQQKPTRKTPDDSAPWVEEMYRKTGPLPAYIFSHTSLQNAQTGAPAWAANEDMKTPPHYKNWDDLALFLRDYIRYHKMITPHMKHRTYGVLWEPEIYTPKYLMDNKHLPVYTSQEQLVDIQKKVRALIKKEDPESIVVGPTSMWCYGLEWWDNFFKAGILNQVDELSTHLYCVAPPENNDIPNKIATLRKMMCQYTGNELEIFNTETGFKSKVGNENRIFEHAGWSVRYAMIMKGEGLKHHLHFYPFDISMGDEWDTYGLCFYLDGIKKYNYNTLHFSPKPAICAMAACSSQLLGAKPVRHLRDWGRGLWGYVFNRDGSPVIVLWTPAKHIKVPVVVGETDAVEVVDIMGNGTTYDVKDGIVEIEASPDPVYINGAKSEIYLSEEMTKQSPTDSHLLTIFPGQKREITLPANLTEGKKITSVKCWGGVKAMLMDAVISLEAPYGIPEMCVPVVITDQSNVTRVQWVNIGSEIKLRQMSVGMDHERMGLKVSLENHTNKDRNVRLSMISDFDSEWQIKEDTVGADMEQEIFIPFGKEVHFSGNTAKALNVTLKIAISSGAEIEENQKIYFLTAYSDSNTEHLFPDMASISGEGSSGKIDNSAFKFSWDEKYLHAEITVTDDIHNQQVTDLEKIWSEDSIQFGFDTDPESEELYNPLGGIYNKKISEITISKAINSDAATVWRHRTFNEGELHTGNVSEDGFLINIKRDENTHTTHYDCQIPWKQIGLDHVSKGKSIGISILVNDSDGGETHRQVMELFGGIMHGKDYHKYGRLTLR